MLKKIVLLLFFLVFSVLVYSQGKNWQDTFLKYIRFKPDPVFTLAGRNSFVQDRPVKIDGIKIGASFGGRIYFLIGYHQTRFPVEKEVRYNAFTNNELIVKQITGLKYLSLGGEYIFYQTPRWDLGLGALTGYGWARRVENLPDGTWYSESYPKFIPIETSFSAFFRVLNWFGLGAGIGYRYAAFNKRISDDFSGPIYTFGLGLMPRTLYRAVFDQKKNDFRKWDDFVNRSLIN